MLIEDIVWSRWISLEMDIIMPKWSHTIRSMRCVHVYKETCHVRSPARVIVRTVFLLYTAGLHRVVEQHRLPPHRYADDKQIYGACSPSTTAEFQNCLSSCVDDVATLMQSNWLQLNSAKTEVLWCACSRRQHQIMRSGTRISADDVIPSAFVRDIGMYIDADVSMWTHVVKAVSSCFAILRHLRSICRSISKLVVQSLVVALVLTRLYYVLWKRDTVSHSLNCNRSSMLPLVWFSCRVSLITWRHFYVNYIGCSFLKGLITSWHCWFSSASMVWHRRIVPVNSVVWLTQRVVNGCARRRQRNS